MLKICSMFLLCRLLCLCLCLRLCVGTMSRCRQGLKRGSCTQFRGDFVLLFVFVCFFVFFVSVFVPAPKWVHALITEERWFHPFTSTGPITTQQVALQWNYYCMKLTTSQWKRARDQSLLDVAQCNFYCKEQNKARWKRAQVYRTNKSTALQEVYVYNHMYIHMWVFLFVCACVCTRSVLKART